MIRNLFFDLDDTLLDFHRSEHDALKETLLAAGIPVTEALLAEKKIDLVVRGADNPLESFSMTDFSLTKIG